MMSLFLFQRPPQGPTLHLVIRSPVAQPIFVFHPLDSGVGYVEITPVWWVFFDCDNARKLNH